MVHLKTIIIINFSDVKRELISNIGPATEKLHALNVLNFVLSIINTRLSLFERRFLSEIKR